MSAAAETPVRRSTLADRVLVALPLASAYVWIAGLYCIEAWKRATPWLFTDELELTQLSRSIAATGHAARRGEPHSFRSFYTVFTAVFWRIDDVAAAFAAIKYADTLVMAAVVFPTYFLARMVVGRAPALFAAIAAAAIPSVAYSSWIVEETLAYPYSALCFLLIAKALYVRTRGWIVGALLACLFAPIVRGELAVIPAALAVALLCMWWTSARTREWRNGWSIGDWVGWSTLCIGGIVFLSGFLSHHIHAWYAITTYYKHRLFIYGDWASGSLAIGMGVLPMILGLAALWRLPGEQPTLVLRVFRSVSLGGLTAVWLYTAVKGAYLSTVFASRVEERNLIYIAPLLMVGTAIVLERRRVNLVALAAAAAYSVYVALGVPLFIAGGYYSDALSLAIFQQANRYFLLSSSDARVITAIVCVVGIGLTLVLTRVRNGAATALAAVLAVAILAWCGTAEFAAAAGNITVSRDIRPTLGEPFTWVDDATHLKPTLYLAQGVADQNPEWLLEFWNRSITTVSSLDGTIGGPGPAGAPNITARGQLFWTLHPSDPGKVFDYAVEDWPCIDFAGTLTATHEYRGGSATPRLWRLIQLTKPNRLRAVCVGIYSDGWSGPNDSTYFRFSGKHRGRLRIVLSRQSFPGSSVDIQLATITMAHNQPALGRVLHHRVVRVESNKTTVVSIPTPASSFAVHTVVRNKFTPGNGDVRTLGAQITYGWSLTKGQ